MIRTAVYATGSGEELWARRYSGADGGTSAGAGTNEDYATVAYRLGP